MKIIDEKGKLFGLINIIDLVLLLIVAALAVEADVLRRRAFRNSDKDFMLWYFVKNTAGCCRYL